jgi:RNA polymerase sigma-70 factor (ECF subfamily)
MTHTDERLSQIQTVWSDVQLAHTDDAPGVRTAQERLLATYSGAIRRYLRAAVRTDDAADELLQEFSLRFVRGDFQNVTPERGRFRNFLKTCLYHLVVDYQRRQRRARLAVADTEQLVAAASPADTPESDAAFLRSWREDLLRRAWKRLKEDQRSTGKPYYSVLKARAENAELSSAELAELLAERLQRELTPNNLRVLLHRAREVFAEFLLEAVTDSLPEARRDLIEEELIELQLLEYCRAALEQQASN